MTTKNSTKVRLWAALALPAYLAAQQMPPPPSAATDTLDLREVVISSARWKQTSEHIPAQVAVITPKQVAQFQPQTAADLLGISGKVFIQKKPAGRRQPDDSRLCYESVDLFGGRRPHEHGHF